MTYTQLLEVLAARGVSVRLEDDTLHLEPAASAQEFIDDLRRLKPQIVQHLRGEIILDPVPLTAWDLLRADWKLLPTLIKPEDTQGSITVVSDGPVGMVIPCNLLDLKSLAGLCKTLKEKYPDPLVIRISAQHGDVMYLRLEHTKAQS